jgi:hypothetical protein
MHSQRFFQTAGAGKCNGSAIQVHFKSASSHFRDRSLNYFAERFTIWKKQSLLLHRAQRRWKAESEKAGKPAAEKYSANVIFSLLYILTVGLCQEDF